MRKNMENTHLTKSLQEALNWFNGLTLEEQFYKTIEHNDLISGDNTRHPNTLTKQEIETIYLADS